MKQTFYPNPHNEGKDKDIWIGFSDQEQNGVFRWVDGQALSTSKFTNWADNQPKNTPAWDCGSIYAGNPNLNWETMSCFREQGFICKIPAGTELGETGQSSYAGKNFKMYGYNSDTRNCDFGLKENKYSLLFRFTF